MNGKFAVPGLLLMLCAGPIAARAQSYWQLSYKGTATFTNNAGKLVTQPMTDRTLVQRCVQNNVGASNNNLALVLHFNANAIGDAFEVVNTADPNLFNCQVFTLAFKESYTNAAGTEVKTFAYIYNNDSDVFNDPSGHSRGSAVFTRSQVPSKGGGTNTVITGTVHFWLGVWMDNAAATNAIICSGTFTSKGPLNLP
jgi:hypothetical protein